MPPRGVKKGTKRARQYEHVKESAKDRGASEGRAEEIAARTVNKEKRALGRVADALEVVAEGAVAEPARRPALRRQPDARRALRAGQAARHRGALEDEQDAARAGGRAQGEVGPAGRLRRPAARRSATAELTATPYAVSGAGGGSIGSSRGASGSGGGGSTGSGASGGAGSGTTGPGSGLPGGPPGGAGSGSGTTLGSGTTVSGPPPAGGPPSRGLALQVRDLLGLGVGALVRVGELLLRLALALLLARPRGAATRRRRGRPRPS